MRSTTQGREGELEKGKIDCEKTPMIILSKSGSRSWTERAVFLALPGVTAFELVAESEEDGGLVEAPGGAEEIVGRSVATDPLHDHLRWQEFQHVNQSADVV